MNSHMKHTLYLTLGLARHKIRHKVTRDFGSFNLLHSCSTLCLPCALNVFDLFSLPNLILEVEQG